jgi:hypothetical protein
MTSNLTQQVERLLSEGKTEAEAVELVMQRAKPAQVRLWAREWVQAVAGAVARSHARQVERQAARPAPGTPERKPRPVLSDRDRQKLAEARQCRSQEQREYEQQQRERTENHLWDELSVVFDHYRDSLKLEVTAELLATSIKLGDGTEVTWGAATAEQLRQRATMLLGMAAGDIESAAALCRAADMIDQAGVRCLNELHSQAA